MRSDHLRATPIPRCSTSARPACEQTPATGRTACPGSPAAPDVQVVSCRVAVLRLDARDPGSLTAFWAGLLHRTVLDDPHGPFVGGSDTRTGLRFVPSAGATTGPGRVHLHVTSTSATDQQRTVAAALDRGARHLDVGQSPQEEHVVLADPEDNAFCVIEPTTPSCPVAASSVSSPATAPAGSGSSGRGHSTGPSRGTSRRRRPSSHRRAARRSRGVDRPWRRSPPGTDSASSCR